MLNVVLHSNFDEVPNGIRTLALGPSILEAAVLLWLVVTGPGEVDCNLK